MNEILKKWLSEREAEKRAALQAEKEKTLRQLGLFDPEKTSTRTVYLNSWKREVSEEEYQRLQRLGAKTYVTSETVNSVIDITDDEFRMIKEYLDAVPATDEPELHNPAEQKNQQPKKQANSELRAENSAIFVSGIIRAISIIFTIFIISGGIVGLIAAISTGIVGTWAAIVYFILILILAAIVYILFITSWAVLRILANISVNIFRIRQTQQNCSE